MTCVRRAADAIRSYPVLILALDTTTRAGSVAVTRHGELIAIVEGDASRTHGERLPAEIEQALKSAQVDARTLDLLAVARGPGAFTGLRIGLAAMQGLAMVHGIPVVGVSALDALAEIAAASIAAPGALVTWMDAQRGEVFSAQFAVEGPGRGWSRQHDPVVATPSAILDALARTSAGPFAFAGDGAVRYRAAIEAALPGSRVSATSVPLAPAIAMLGAREAAAGHAGPPHALQPLYVRRPDAELDRLRREAT
jgi:tRNA threonylcarbamoyladenosine biosynthesis protein TsaB